MLKIQSLFLSLLLVGSVAFTSCSDDDDNGGPNWAQATDLVVNKEAVALAGTAPAKLVVKSPSIPEASSDAAWLTVGDVAHKDGSKSLYEIELTAEPNPAYEARTATVTVKCGNKSKSVTVTQYQCEAVNILSVTPGNELDANGGTLKITFEATAEVNVVYPEWLTRMEPRSIDEGSVEFSYNANVSSEARGGDIVISLVKDASVSAVVAVTQEKAESSTNMSSNAMQLAAKLYAGVNIGNTLEVPGGETGWGNPVVNENYIRGLKQLGFNAVRVPCAWDSHVSDAASNTIDPKWLSRVDEVIGWIVANDMYAVLNIHWDGGWLEESCVNGYDEAVDKKQRDYWTQIATKLNHYDEHLLFAGMNEPGQQNQSQAGKEKSVKAIMAYQQTFVDAVRGTGGNNASRVLIHQAPFTNIDESTKGLYALPEDKVADRSMVEVHFYDPSDYTIMDKDGAWSPTIKLYWGSKFHVDGSDRNCTWGEESHVDSQFKKVQNYYVNKGIPVIVGEYSVSHDRSGVPGIDIARWKDSRAYWTGFGTASAKNHGCVPFYWETGGDIVRINGNAKNSYVIDALMKGAAAGNYPF